MPGGGITESAKSIRGSRRDKSWDRDAHIWRLPFKLRLSSIQSVTMDSDSLIIEPEKSSTPRCPKDILCASTGRSRECSPPAGNIKNANNMRSAANT